MIPSIRKVKRRGLKHLACYVMDYLPSLYVARKIINTIDMAEFERCRTELLRKDPRGKGVKFMDIRKHMAIAVRRIYKLNLHRSNPLKILDIGTGSGYFVYACNYFGHTAVGSDLADIAPFNECVKILQIDRRVWRINPFERMPEFKEQFDVVTGFWICFDKNDHVPWGADKWHFFLDDLVSRSLKQTGQIYLTLNPLSDENDYPDELLNFFINNGAEIKDNAIHFKSLDSLITVREVADKPSV